jgi:hypothetical protein
MRVRMLIWKVKRVQARSWSMRSKTRGARYGVAKMILGTAVRPLNYFSAGPRAHYPSPLLSGASFHERYVTS